MNDETRMRNEEAAVMITQPAKHGFVVDVSDGTRRTHVRVFEFEEQPFQGGVCEMPVPLTAPVAIQRLREVMEAIRESISRPELKLEATENAFCPPTVLFLDIDGVLNRTPQEMGSLMPEKVALLDGIVMSTGCRVVITSSWRRSPEKMQQVAKMLRDLNNGEGCIWGETPVMDYESPSFGGCGPIMLPVDRGIEIKTWLEKHDEVKVFVVLDDEAINGFEHVHVRTDSGTGLTAASAGAVIKRLNEGRAAR